MTDHEATMAVFRAVVALAERLTGEKLEILCDGGSQKFWLSCSDRWNWIKPEAESGETPSQEAMQLSPPLASSVPRTAS